LGSIADRFGSPAAERCDALSPHGIRGTSVPRFFFDIHDDIDLIDNVGMDFPNLVAARSQAALALSEFAKEALPGNGPDKQFTVTIRDEHGKVVLTCTLVFKSSPSI
jgi:hypothetical protein